ncbi:MAG: 1-acyl-sn-glycerol-3-phosphate acyltransferase, partial [Fimbriimonadaceae bacterium]|nr:1-acyl-sn-glycerol-3-phosphate acyltransferase [Alphaproteobacteria bacterium]
EWARIWPLQSLIRAMGAYFIRRDSGDPLYRRVLSRYVHMATREGVTQAIFPEGGLTRDGKLRAPKLGLLSYMVSGFDPEGPRDIVFIPVGLNYDRVIEDRNLTRKIADRSGVRHQRIGAYKVTKYILGALFLAIRGRWYRFGYASVNFGKPISLRRHLADNRFDFRKLDEETRFVEISKLGEKLMTAVGEIIPVLPVALAAHAFLDTGDQELSRLEIKARIFEIIGALDERHAHIHIPRGDRDYSVETGVRMLVLRNIVFEQENGLYRANPNETVMLAYYANSIEHLLTGP